MSRDPLGLGRPISRRDFLDGVALAVAGATVAPWMAALAQEPDTAATYPPLRQGLRGAHPGAFESFHALRDGLLPVDPSAAPLVDGGYDLVVVGAGISGLAAAHRYRQRFPGARVLLLDNHDDVGGHAKRNEFRVGGRTYLGYGGTQSIESPRPYSATARRLLDDLGVRVGEWDRVHDARLYRSLRLAEGTFLRRERWGHDALVATTPDDDLERFLREAPLSERVRADLRRLHTDGADPWATLDEAGKRRRLAQESYADFLRGTWRVDPGVMALLQARPHILFGAGIDVVPAQDAWGLGYPGFQGLGLSARAGAGQNPDSQWATLDDFYFHFPDGNATLARLLVRSLIPDALPGRTAADSVTARLHYDRLDREGQAARIRLGSTVVRVAHVGEPVRAREVEVTYLREGRFARVRARHVVLACWHAAIPYLCPELPATQRTAMAYAIKVPLVYTTVLLRRWTAFTRLGVHAVQDPDGWHSELHLDEPVRIGAHRPSRDPSQPIVCYLTRAACAPGRPIREQHRLGRQELYTTPFATIEREVRDQLARMLGPGGFDPAEDILGLTVNRWPHGYSYQYNSLADPFWQTDTEQPCRFARQPFRRITIANADAGAYAYTDGAIDHGVRAAEELPAE